MKFLKDGLWPWPSSAFSRAYVFPDLAEVPGFIRALSLLSFVCAEIFLTTRAIPNNFDAILEPIIMQMLHEHPWPWLQSSNPGFMT